MAISEKDRQLYATRLNAYINDRVIRTAHAKGKVHADDLREVTAEGRDRIGPVLQRLEKEKVLVRLQAKSSERGEAKGRKSYTYALTDHGRVLAEVLLLSSPAPLPILGGEQMMMVG